MTDFPTSIDQGNSNGLSIITTATPPFTNINKKKEIESKSSEIGSLNDIISSYDNMSDKNNVISSINTISNSEFNSNTCIPTDINSQIEEKKASKQFKISLNEFEIIALAGKGSYGEVLLVKKKLTGKQYALKVIDKNFLRKEQKQYQVYIEREVLTKLDHPNIIKLYSSFQDKTKLYFVLEYCGGGEFSNYLRVQRELTKDQIRFYAGEMVNILEYLHENGIAHRDFKPENLMLTTNGHIKCIDFGTAKFVNRPDMNLSQIYGPSTKETNKIVENDLKIFMNNQNLCLDYGSIFVGTPQFVSPEMLENSQCGAPADLWAFGCIIYLMALGKYPFNAPNEFHIFEKIKNLNIDYPYGMDPEIKDLIQNLIKLNPKERLGAGVKGSLNDMNALKSHPLFAGIDFTNLINLSPPSIEIHSPYRNKKKANNISSFFSEVIKDEEVMNKEEIVKQNSIKKEIIENVNQIRVIISGLILEKFGIFYYKPRHLILTGVPRLIYFDPITHNLEGEISLTFQTRAKSDGRDQLIISTVDKSYTFKVVDHPVETWIQAINSCAQSLNRSKI